MYAHTARNLLSGGIRVYAAMYVYTLYTCARLYAPTAVCITSWPEVRDWQQVYCTYALKILIVYYKNLQKFCKQRGSTNKFDLYINKLGWNYYKTCFCFKKNVYRILIRIIQQSSSIQQIQIAWCAFKNYIISRWWVFVHVSYLWGYNALTSFIILVGL